MSTMILKAQVGFTPNGAQGSTPPTGTSNTCEAYTVTAGLFAYDPVIVDGEVTFTVPTNVFDLNTIRLVAQYSDNALSDLGDATAIFDYQITTISAVEKKFIVKLKNDVDYSDNYNGKYYKVGYSIQVSNPMTGYNFTIEWGNGGVVSSSLPLGLPPILKGTCIKSINDFNQTSQGTTVQGNVVTNDHSEDGSVITITGATFDGTPVTLGSSTTIPGKGTLIINSDGSYTFVPDPNFTGTVPAITYQTSNGNDTGGGNLTIDVIKITDSGSNATPVANDDAVYTYSAITVTGNLLNNDYDANGNNISITGVTGGSLGSPMTVQGQQPVYDSNGIFIGYVTVTAGQLTINSNGTYTFVPAPGFYGTVNPVTHTVSDGSAADTATLNITVTANKNVVYANNDSDVQPQGVDHTGNVLANDFNPNAGTGPFNVSSASFSVNGGSSQPLTVGAPTTIPNVGTLTLNANGTYTFDPLPTFVGNISVPYTVCNSANICSTAALNLTSTAVKIVANDDIFSASPIDTTIGGDTPSVFINDTYGSNGAVNSTNSTVSQIGIWPNGVTMNPDGTITVAAPTATNSGTTPDEYTLTYQICDKVNTVPSNCDTATVTINVANNLTTTTDIGSGPTGTAFTAIANVVSNDSLNNEIPVIGNAPGQVTLSTTGTGNAGITFNPSTGAVDVAALVLPGTYTFQYQICVNGANPVLCKTETVTITVGAPVACYNPVNNIAAGTDTKHGITLLKRAGTENGNWPMVRKSAHTVLESNTKGFVVTRVANPITAISNPVEGMMVYDTTAKCLKIYSDGVWNCFSTPACP